MNRFKYMVVHGGNSHQDDLNAIRLAFGSDLVARCVRRAPTAAELEDPEVLVADVGGIYDINKGDFDHHQLPREAPADCSAWMVARYLGVQEQLMKLYPWWGYMGILDSKGPGALARLVGLPTDVSMCLIDLGGANRIATDQLAQYGAEDAQLKCDVPGLRGIFAHQLRTEGYAMLEACRQFSDWMGSPTVELVPLFSFEHGDQVIAPRNVCCPDVAGIHEPPPLSFLKLWESEATAKLVTDKRIIGSILPSERGGWALYRNDNVKGSVDLSRLEGMVEVAFAHKGGFLATTAKDVTFMNAVRLFQTAVVIPEPKAVTVTLVPGSGPAIKDPPALATRQPVEPTDE